MKTSQRRRRWGALLLLLALSGVPAHARAHHGEAWARDRFASAERMREALNGRPPAERTRRDYQRVLNSYRNVYYGAPTSTKADPSVVAVAETLVEMGRRFDDDKILNEAIAQYRFLRKEYPGSRYRCDALFTIGEIYKDDLNDAEQARSAFEEFLHRYPQQRQAEDAKREIAALDRDAERGKKAETQKQKQKKPGKEVAAAKSKNAERSAGDAADSEDDSTAEAKPAEAKSGENKSEVAAAEANGERAARVTSIRHWSTPDYTRVAIDLENEIKFGSQRISNPDRIFFDLRGTRLASTLVGKSFDVDDGFLKKIRVAQFQPGRTRVVLEVDNLSDYEAFLLPNPYRLIIDIHGKNNRKNMHAMLLKDSAAMADVEAPPTAGSRSNASADDLTPEEALKEAEAKVRGDLRAEAGKAPVTSEDVGDETKVAPKDNVAAAKTSSSAAVAKKDKSTTPAVKKVMVEADDDDVVAPPSHAKRKSASRLASNRASNDDLDMREAKPTASGDRSLIRALGLKIGKIVIDPGHGGHDTGTIGPKDCRKKIWCWKWDGGWASCCRRGWARKWSTRARTIRLFRSKRGLRSPTSSAPTCLFRFMPTPATIPMRAAWKPIT